MAAEPDPHLGRASRRRTARWGLSAVLALCLVAAPVCADSIRHDIRARLPDGRSLRFACSGAGSPTVLMESGFAANADAWYKAFDVQPGQKLYLAPADRVRIW